MLAQDLKDNLNKSEAFSANLLKWIDGYIQKNVLDIPFEEQTLLDDGYRMAEPGSLDLLSTGVNTIIWATGNTFESLITSH
jgi:hypothetical protein